MIFRCMWNVHGQVRVHTYVFFDNEIKAAIARKFGMCLLEQAMRRVAALGLIHLTDFFQARIISQKMVLEI